MGGGGFGRERGSRAYEWAEKGTVEAVMGDRACLQYALSPSNLAHTFTCWPLFAARARRESTPYDSSHMLWHIEQDGWTPIYAFRSGLRGTSAPLTSPPLSFPLSPSRLSRDGGQYTRHAQPKEMDTISRTSYQEAATGACGSRTLGGNVTPEFTDLTVCARVTPEKNTHCLRRGHGRPNNTEA